MAKSEKPRRIQPDDNPIKVDRESTDMNTSAVSVRTDQAILDPDHDLAVQIPEGVGASAIDAVTPIEAAFEDARQVEDVFRAGDAHGFVSPDNSDESHKH